MTKPGHRSVLTTVLEIFDHVYSNTSYEDALLKEAEHVFGEMRQSIPPLAKTPEGQKLVVKFNVLANTVSAEGPFRDMVKIIWRMVKMMSGSPQDKLCLFFLGVGTMCDYLLQSKGKVAQIWLQKVEEWLGKQLTIGGKGVTGDGEGSVGDRIQRFFSTPYLHDFD